MKPESGRPIIKNYHSGSRWWGAEQLAHHEVETIKFVFLHNTENINEREKQISEWLDDNGYGEITIEAYFCVGEDDETNTDDCYIDEVFYPEDFDDALDSCPFLMDEEKEKSKIDMQEYCDKLDEEKFKLYEP